MRRYCCIMGVCCASARSFMGGRSLQDVRRPAVPWLGVLDQCRHMLTARRTVVNRRQMPDDAQLYELATRVGRRLLASKRRLVVAESCTAGWIAKVITDVPDSSSWFECGYVTYSNAAK